jgi:hypothetical protein
LFRDEWFAIISPKLLLKLMPKLYILIVFIKVCCACLV